VTRRLVAGSLFAVLGVTGVVWAVGWGASGDALGERERTVVEAVEAGDHASGPADAAGFVRDNLDVLLSRDVAAAIDGDQLAELFRTALGTDEPEPADLLEEVVAGVAAEGATHDDHLRRAFADAAAANLAWVDDRVNAPANHAAGEVPDDVRARYLETHDFLREVFRDADAAERLRAAVYDYGLAETAAAPDAGQERGRRLTELGRVQAFFDIAQANAEMGAATEAEDVDAYEAAEEADQVRTAESDVDAAVWLAVDLYAADPAVRDAAQGLPFVDANGALETEMSPEHEQAFRDWATSLRGTDADPGPIYGDEDQVDVGVSEVYNPDHGIGLDGRY
jgi:hypothetical protein